MTIKEEIEDLQYQIDKIDGKSALHNIGNRIYGAIGIGLPIFLYYAFGKNPLAFIATPLVIDGIGDLVTGKHHFLSYRLFKAHPKYKLEKILSNPEKNA
jgi:hypothetical protein